MNIFLAIVLGGLFGFALYKSGASNPKRLLAMLRLEDLTLMKAIVFGIGLGSVLLSLSALVGLFDISHLSVKSANLGVVIGGLIFGLGFGSVGTCPGTCVAATTGIDFKKAISAVVGGLIGAFTFSLSYGWFNGLGLFKSMDLGKLTLFNVSDKYPALFNLGFGGLLVVGVILAAVAVILPVTISNIQSSNKGAKKYVSIENN